MTDMNLIQRLQAEAAELEAKVLKLRNQAFAAEAAAEEIRVTLRVIQKYMPGADEGVAEEEEPQLGSNKLSMLESAVLILKESGRPMTIVQIRDRLLEAGYEHPDPDLMRQSLTGVLGREYRDGRLLSRPGHGQYGLAEWKRPAPSPGAEQLDIERNTPETAGTASGAEGSPADTEGR
jgi:hypothetical protein